MEQENISKERSKSSRRFRRRKRVGIKDHVQTVEPPSKGKQLTTSVQMAMVLSELDRLRIYQGDDHVLGKDWRQCYDDVSDLHYAAFYGDITSVKRIVKDMRSSTKRSNVDIPTSDGPKLLKEPKPKSVEVYGAANYAGFFLSTTPLMMAAQQGCLPVVKFLVEHARADVNACDSIGLTSLSLACAFDQRHVAKYLLTRHAQRNIIESKNGMSPLILAGVNNHTKMCKLMLRHHASVDIADTFGRQVIHYAAWNYNLELVEYLYHHNNDLLDAKDGNGNTPLHLLVSDEIIDPREADDMEKGAINKNLAGVFRQLTKFSNSTVDIKRKSIRGTDTFGEEHKCLIRMIELGADVDAQNNNGQTPLHVICSRLTPVVYSQCHLFIEEIDLTQSLLVMLKILLEGGCVAVEQDRHGDTPLTLSVGKRNWLAAKILSANATIRSEVTVDPFRTLSETIAYFGWTHLYEHEQVEKDIEFMASALMTPRKNTSRKSKMVARILKS